MTVRKRLFFAFISILFFANCMKKDTPYTLPAKGGSTIMQINMGFNGGAYDSVVYVSIANQKIIKSIERTSWDLCFDASASGFKVLSNSANNARIIKTTSTNMQTALTKPLPAVLDLSYDYLDSSVIGNWLNTSNVSKNEVFIINTISYDSSVYYYKIQLQSVDVQKYVLRYAALQDTTFKTITIPKNDLYNNAYFSFNNGGQTLLVEPPKTDWDIQFTKYGDYALLFGVFQFYPVSGALLNSYNTQAAVDNSNSKTFSSYTLQDANAMNFSTKKNTVGYNWKVWNGTNYTISSNTIYGIKTQNNQIYKLHFTDFMELGVHGFPKFELERLQ